MRRLLSLTCAAAPLALGAQQHADTSFHPVVAKPAYAANGPLVRLDEAHHNFHTTTGRYKPFVDLLRADGYRVEPNASPFTAASLRGTTVLVIANARGGETNETAGNAAFTPDEVAAVHAWVESGGALLLIADHAPFGAAAEALGRAFGVEMGKGFARDTTPGNSFVSPLGATAGANGDATFLRYTRDNGLLGDHAITRGRDASERLSTVVTFTGQSLTIPPNATPILRLSPHAQERPTRADQLADPRDSTAYTAIGGHAQGIAMTVGRGRVVLLGEAALLSAQVIDFANRPSITMGMNVPGTDDRQFGLNVVHWLSRLLP